MPKITILGAGLTGLSTAYHLEKKGFFDYKIFEKEEQAGGLCRSAHQKGYTFDFTGHLIHINNNYIYNFLNQILDMEELNSINRKSFIYSQNIYTKYPYQINLHGLPNKIIQECITGFKNRNKNLIPKNYYEWILKNLGEGFGKNFFFGFDSKKFAYNLKDISPSCMGRFFINTTLKQILKGASGNNTDIKIGYNANFLYPSKKGISFIIENLLKKIKSSIQVKFEATEINLKEKWILFENGHREKFNIIVNTIPLDILLKKIKGKSNMDFIKASNNLKCNSVLNFNLGIKSNNLSDKHWIYFPEKNYSFYRIGFPHNFSKNSVPYKHSSLYGEISYFNKNDPEILRKAIHDVKNLLQIDDNDIDTTKIINIKHAYVIYNLWREKNLKKLLSRLEKERIYSIGRYGAWKYSSMEEAILDGKTISNKLIRA